MQRDAARFSAPAVRSLRQHVMEELRTAILQGQIQPGERLIEANLAGQFGVSRGCVREALRGLEKEGLVVASPYRETRVATTSEEEVVEVLLPIRVVIETFVARKLVGQLTPVQVGSIERIIAAMHMAAAANDKLRLTQLDVDFHRQMLTFVDIPAIRELWTGIDTRIRGKFLLDTLATDPQQLVRIHEELLAMLRTGQPETVGVAVAGHIYGALPPRVAQNGASAAVRTLAELLGVASLVAVPREEPSETMLGVRQPQQ